MDAHAGAVAAGTSKVPAEVDVVRFVLIGVFQAVPHTVGAGVFAAIVAAWVGGSGPGGAPAHMPLVACVVAALALKACAMWLFAPRSYAVTDRGLEVRWTVSAYVPEWVLLVPMHAVAHARVVTLDKKVLAAEKRFVASLSYVRCATVVLLQVSPDAGAMRARSKAAAMAGGTAPPGGLEGGADDAKAGGRQGEEIAVATGDRAFIGRLLHALSQSHGRGGSGDVAAGVETPHNS